MNLILESIFILFLFLSKADCFQASNIAYLAGPSRGSPNVTPPTYSDNPNTIGFSGFNLDPINPSFILYASMQIDETAQVYSNIFQIVHVSNPDVKLVALTINGVDPANKYLELYSQPNASTQEGYIKALAPTSYSQFVFSMRKTVNQIDFYILYESKTATFEKLITFATTISDWSPVNYIFQLSNLKIKGSSRQEEPLRGVTYHVHLIRNTFIEVASDSNLKRFAAGLFPYSDQVLLFNYFQNPIPGESIQITDQSLRKVGFATSASQSSYPQFHNWYAEFNAKQYFSIKDNYYKQIGSITGEFSVNFGITFSFWLYVDISTASANHKIISFIGDSPELVIYIRKSTSTTYKINTFTQALITQKYYFVLICYFTTPNGKFQELIVIDGSTITKQTITSATLNFQSTSITTQIGDPSSSFSGLFRISQYSTYLGRGYIVDGTIANSIIPNCSVVYYYRETYMCILCATNFYLDFNTKQCLDSSQCNISGYLGNDNVRGCYRQCPYKCKTCDASNNCLECSSTQRDISKNCKCYSGYDDFTTPSCHCNFISNSLISS